MNVDEIRRVGVVGTGMMGHSVAQLFAQAGYEVAFIGRKEESIKRGINNIKANLKALIANSLMSEKEAELALSRIYPYTDLKEGVRKADFVVENIVENLEIKQDLFRKLDQYCSAHVILGTDTSGLSITEIASATNREDRVVGTHFWNPPHLMPLVEIVKGEKTSEETLRVISELLKKCGKEPVIVKKDVLGFIGNRLFHAIFREAIALVQDGVATPADIDKVVKGGFGLRLPVLGPMETIDLVGLDLVLSVHQYLLKDLDRSSEPQLLLKEKIKKGELGAKSGRGFYDWSERSIEELKRIRDEEIMARLKQRQRSK